MESDELEADVLPLVAADGQLSAYRHQGFWQPMDSVTVIDWKNYGENQAPGSCGDI